jgi:hypothetical protein
MRRLAIFGSRSLAGNDRVVDIIMNAIDLLKPTAIVTAGEPEGVCETARSVAKEIPLPLHLFFVPRQKRAFGMWHWRSVAMYENCDHVLLIHDGVSDGTKNELALAIKMKIPYTYVKV